MGSVSVSHERYIETLETALSKEGRNERVIPIRKKECKCCVLCILDNMCMTYSSYSYTLCTLCSGCRTYMYMCIYQRVGRLSM